ncbi:MAG: peptidoglycan-associated lipoprotein Pal [Rhodobacteraceae bacterium]|nr:peptidoglycan-associated lipoprotein Pal [Paracoccaceae bacterium]
MTRISTLLAVCAALALAGCGDRFGGAGGAGSAGGYGATAGSASDPSSIAYFQQSVGDTVLFTVDESTLSAAAKATLVQQARWLTANPQYTAVIEGHADEQGTREYNLALGARRANAVQEFLTAQGIQPGRLSTVTYGKERPVALCSAEECYAKNRRAVTVLATGGLS